MSDSSFAQARLGLIEQAKNIDVLREQAFVPSFLDPLWRAFIDTAITASLLPPGEYPVRWSKPKQQSADRVEEAKAAMMEMRLGIRSRPEIIEADGRDPDDVNDEIAKDKAERDRLGIISDGDPSQTSSSGVWQADPSRDTSKTKPAPGQSE
jgi:capsid protein